VIAGFQGFDNIGLDIDYTLNSLSQFVFFYFIINLFIMFLHFLIEKVTLCHHRQLTVKLELHGLK
jgi:hypothetical protein